MFGSLTEKFSALFSRFSTSSVSQKTVDDAMQMVKNTLLEADVPYDVVTHFIQLVQADLIGKKVFSSLKPAELVMKVVHDRIVELLGGKQSSIGFSFQIPSVTVIAGLQGSGKTTTLAKLAQLIQKEAAKRNKKRRILVCSVDYYRPAAAEQLEVLAKTIGIDYYAAQAADPVGAAVEAVQYAQKNHYEHCFIDTAGRLHVDQDLLKELSDIIKCIKPTYTFLVLDGMIGQESLRVAQTFEAIINATGIILTKMDGDTRGGAAFACYYMVKKPVIFLGIGEKTDDIEYFNPERIANRIIGLGDMHTLIEKAEEKIKISDQQDLQKALNRGKLTLQDFAKQLDMMSSLGSLSSLMKYIPGISGMKIDPAHLQKGEIEIKKFKAIIGSMTLKERLNARIINDSRAKRIAQGSGTTAQDITLLLERFEQSQQFVKILKRRPHF
ncbi:MAG: signal recognition particle receptor subunit alpha [Candidatus Babeliaceae bacterium]|nr:signal recognition particle receptor subunit alpha [Candidatus Babeliaceae bacterium]